MDTDQLLALPKGRGKHQKLNQTPYARFLAFNSIVYGTLQQSYSQKREFLNHSDTRRVSRSSTVLIFYLDNIFDFFCGGNPKKEYLWPFFFYSRVGQKATLYEKGGQIDFFLFIFRKEIKNGYIWHLAKIYKYLNARMNQNVFHLFIFYFVKIPNIRVNLAKI